MNIVRGSPTIWNSMMGRFWRSPIVRRQQRYRHQRCRFHWIGRFRYKLVSHWLDFYLEKAVPDDNMHIDWSQRYKFCLDDYLTFFIVSILAIRGAYASLDQSYWNDPIRQMYLGSFFGPVGAHPFHVEVLCFVWAMNFLTIQLVSIGFRLKHLKWLDIILFLEERISSETVGLLPTEATEVRKKANRMLLVVRNGIFSVSGMTLIFLEYYFYKEYDLENYLKFGIIWAIFYGYTASLITASIYMTNAYIFIVSQIIRVKFKRFEEMLNVMIETTDQDHGSESRILYSFHYLNRLMREYDDYNRFWKWIFTIIVAWRLIIINFMAFVVIFAEIKAFFQMLFVTALFNETLTFVSVLIQVSLVHINMNNAVRKLRKIMIQHHGQPYAVPTKIKTIIYMEMLSDTEKFGQKIINGSIIEMRHVIRILQEFSAYFFLLAKLSFMMKN